MMMLSSGVICGVTVRLKHGFLEARSSLRPTTMRLPDTESRHPAQSMASHVVGRDDARRRVRSHRLPSACTRRELEIDEEVGIENRQSSNRHRPDLTTGSADLDNDRRNVEATDTGNGLPDVMRSCRGRADRIRHIVSAEPEIAGTRHRPPDAVGLSSRARSSTPKAHTPSSLTVVVVDDDDARFDQNLA